MADRNLTKLGLVTSQLGELLLLLLFQRMLALTSGCANLASFKVRLDTVTSSFLVS